MDLATALQKVIEKISFSEEDYETCVTDIEHIVNEIQLASKKTSSPFRDIFMELGSSATFMKGSAIDLVPDFSYFLAYKVPLKMKPVFQTYDMKDLLYLKSKAKHPLVKDGYVSADDVNEMLNRHIQTTIDGLQTIKCESRDYQLTWQIRKMPNQIFGHSIKALQIADQTPTEISFDFVPVFKFLIFETPMPNVVADNVEGARYWVTYSAFTEGDISVFSKVTPRWQLLKPDSKCKARNAVRLLKTMGRRQKDEHNLDVLPIKNALFWRVQELGASYDNYAEVVLFADLFGKLIHRFVGQFMANLRPRIFRPFNNILMYNKPYRYEDKVDLNDLLIMFGLAPDI